ncbi:hypothetical protein FQN57_003585 [Myotisia sp. PD_48]|nr:hypothetical protein FQN57_003585 [Myotisia sp. PD_48]
MARIVDTIKEDHRYIESCYDNVVKATDIDQQTRWQNEFTWALARHSIGEELVVYPAFEQNLADGKALADKDRQEHQVVKELLKKFQGLKASDSEFLPTIKNLMENLSKHIKEEEEGDLPKLEGALDTAESQGLSTSFKRTKAFVPSRSHPSAPDKPPFETVIGLLTAPIDHIADIFRKFPDEKISPNPSTK